MYTIGLDLGTTNTVAAANAGVLPLHFGDQVVPVLPSVVAYLPNGEVMVGLPARERRAFDVKNTIFSAKRVLGETWHSYSAREFRTHYPFDLVATANDEVGFRTRAGVVTPVDVAAEIARALSRHAGLSPQEISACVSVPASFGVPQRAATVSALRHAGFAAVRCIAEPVATALAYLDRNDVHYGCVYDLGGGTFDLAIVDCSREPVRVVTHGGDPYLGGDDLDQRIAHWAAEVVLRKHGWDLQSDREVFTRLTLEAERAKVRLTKNQVTTLDLEGVDPAAPADLQPIQLDRKAVWNLSAELISRTFAICDEVLGSASLTVRDIQAVFLAGGATLVPGVREAVAEYFGKKLRYELDPMHVVSIGASIAAARPRLSALLSDQ
ncbi:MAG TPA: Hsp70 family protein [Polyangiales bacterium]|jgi:molecular chaperone DnaK|nr:Hsp70 family protein [Polyangiales bacterium]